MRMLKRASVNQRQKRKHRRESDRKWNAVKKKMKENSKWITVNGIKVNFSSLPASERAVLKDTHHTVHSQDGTITFI